MFSSAICHQFLITHQVQNLAGRGVDKNFLDTKLSGAIESICQCFVSFSVSKKGKRQDLPNVSKKLDFENLCLCGVLAVCRASLLERRPGLNRICG